MSARAETVTRLANESVIHSAPIEEFDFEGVAYTMNAIGWRWHNLGTPPDATVLRKTVTHLIVQLEKPIRRPDGTSYTSNSIACGGIGVTQQDGKRVVFFCQTDHFKWARRRALKAWEKWASQKIKPSDTLSKG